jgi:oligoribonuclease
MFTGSEKAFVLVDLETGGLPSPDCPESVIPVLEVGIIVTNADLEIQSQESWVLSHDVATLEAMNPWCVQTHKESGLWDEVLESTLTVAALDIVLSQQYGWMRPGEERSTYCMCGSSVSFDRGFINAHFPGFARLFHYRNIDVSSFNEACVLWDLPTRPRVESAAPHRALGDLCNTLAELRFHRENYYKA